jgi:hypothetical protein
MLCLKTSFARVKRGQLRAASYADEERKYTVDPQKIAVLVDRTHTTACTLRALKCNSGA